MSRRDTKEFNKEVAARNEDKTLKIAFERALSYLEKGELPPNWDKSELLGSETETEYGSEVLLLVYTNMTNLIPGL